MAENCNECSIAWIRGSDYAEVSAYNGKVMANVSKYNGHISYHCQCGTSFIE